MGNNKTTIIQSLRSKGGTFYAFASAIEDIGLNINETLNTVKLTHYALLNIPKTYSSDNTNVNKFNLKTNIGALSETIDNTVDINVMNNTEISKSFMSYALNLETALLNEDSYDYSTSLSVSERVFWKWLKETGAIRWYKDANGNIREGDTPDTAFNYNRVVQAIGRIDGVAQRSSEYGMYNEVYVNIPSSLGTTEPIIFNEIEDINYKYGKKIAFHDSSALIGHSNVNGYYDYYLDNDNVEYITTDGKKSATWVNVGENVGNEICAYYIDKKPMDNIPYTINVKNSTCDFTVLRSKYDCLCLDLNLTNDLYDNYNSYDDLSMTEHSSDYDFNTILVYYSIYDKNNNVIATNLYGVYFINGSEIDVVNGVQFEIPTLKKMKSSSEGFGTSYAFRLNIRTSSIYDDTLAPIIDNSGSANTMISDFNGVVCKLNESLKLLSNHLKITDKLTYKYNDVNNKITNIGQQLLDLQRDVNGILSNKQDEIFVKNIDSSNLTIGNNIINVEGSRFDTVTSNNFIHQVNDMPGENISSTEIQDYIKTLASNIIVGRQNKNIRINEIKDDSNLYGIDNNNVDIVSLVLLMLKYLGQ